MSNAKAARRNIELKATDPDPSNSMRICFELGAIDHGVIEQRETYFRVNHGGLKLREESPGRAHLIRFEQKRRHVFLRRQVRIHLDDVAGLGCFIELEAVAAAESDLSHEHRLVTELRERSESTVDVCARPVTPANSGCSGLRGRALAESGPTC